jgi:hypothetical protein
MAFWIVHGSPVCGDGGILTVMSCQDRNVGNFVDFFEQV